MAELRKYEVSLSEGDQERLETTLRLLEADPIIWRDADAGQVRSRVDRRVASQPALSVGSAMVRDLWLSRPDASRLRVRDYVPGGDGHVPSIVYVHGGGWVLGSAAHFDRQCLELARASGRWVRSVDYRLAPEHPYPAALEDVLLVLRTLPAPPVALIGESAGASLAFGAATRLRDESEQQPGALVFWYPIVDAPGAILGDEPGGDHDSPLLRATDLQWFWDQYTQTLTLGADALPGMANQLSDLPRTALVVAGRDPTAASSRQFAEDLVANGVPVLLVDCPQLPHAFTSLNLDAASDVCKVVVAWIDGTHTTASLR